MYYYIFLQHESMFDHFHRRLLYWRSKNGHSRNSWNAIHTKKRNTGRPGVRHNFTVRLINEVCLSIPSMDSQKKTEHMMAIWRIEKACMWEAVWDYRKSNASTHAPPPRANFQETMVAHSEELTIFVTAMKWGLSPLGERVLLRLEYDGEERRIQDLRDRLWKNVPKILHPNSTKIMDYKTKYRFHAGFPLPKWCACINCRLPSNIPASNNWWPSNGSPLFWNTRF